MAHEPPRLTISKLQRMKRSGDKIAMLTAYDYTMAAILDAAGVDVLLVGDSLAMVVQGHETTLPVSVRDMVYHAEMVVRGSQRALVVVDLPFPHGQLGPRRTIQVAARMMKRSGCQAVKLEGGAQQAATIAALVDAGIPVIAHVGLRPQSIHALGGYRVQRDEEKLQADALAAQQAGAFCVLMECVPAPLAAQITKQLDVPTIGIGAGNACDGQVLVTHDLLGMTLGKRPRFARAFADVGRQIETAAKNYIAAVRTGEFPSTAEAFE
ncbi:MAG: 3-methyl-2-oxobutanoate hydroxymethyltransferase [Pirellulaceae bacterium]|nr:MAG: 3-methyl-2-oxobutanoate hydroxymethyltransferase [Pirellulaceae bacterium]